MPAVGVSRFLGSLESGFGRSGSHRIFGLKQAESVARAEIFKKHFFPSAVGLTHRLTESGHIRVKGHIPHSTATEIVLKLGAKVLADDIAFDERVAQECNAHQAVAGLGERTAQARKIGHGAGIILNQHNAIRTHRGRRPLGSYRCGKLNGSVGRWNFGMCHQRSVCQAVLAFGFRSKAIGGRNFIFEEMVGNLSYI